MGRWHDYLERHPAFQESPESVEDVSSWHPGEPTVCLEGCFTANQLRVMADYMTQHANDGYFGRRKLQGKENH